MATRRRLKTMADVRRYIANLINRTEHGEIDPALSGNLGRLSNTLVRVIEGASLEERVNRLEEKLVKTELKNSNPKWNATKSLKRKIECLEKSSAGSEKKRASFVRKIIPPRDESEPSEDYMRRVNQMMQKSNK